MTEDHIFSKGLTVPGQKIIKEIIGRVNEGKRSRGTKIAQNGLAMRTLCDKCNNDLLGQKLDPYLIGLCKEVDLFLRNKHLLPSQFIDVRDVQLNKVVRAVAGHILASDDMPQARSKVSRILRRFFFEENGVLPNSINLFIWLYPFREQVILRDVFLVDFSRSQSIMWTSAYKTYPLGFAVCENINNFEVSVRGLLDIRPSLTGRINQSFQVRLPVRCMVPPLWPEAPSRNGAVMSGDSTSLSTKPYMNKKSTLTDLNFFNCIFYQGWEGG